jgi:ADP-heptose:LPS heptosyltransferase
MRRILALVPGGVGDQLLFFPTLTTLKQTYPYASIDVVVEPRASSAYRISTLVQQVLKFDFKARNSLADIGNLLGTIRDRNYDVVLSLGTKWSVRFLLWLTGIPERVGYEGEANFFLTKTVPLNPDQYAARMYHDLTRGLGINMPCPPIKLNLPKADLEWAQNLQKQLGLGENFILLHGGSSQLAQAKGIYKIYDPQKWVEVIKTIQPQLGNMPIALVRGPEDEDFVRSIRQSLPQLPVISPPDLGKLAATIANASLLLCTDSAPMHLGVAVGTALVCLFGPTDPAKLLPSLTDPRIRFLKAESGKSINDISPQAIIDKILSN